MQDPLIGRNRPVLLAKAPLAFAFALTLLASWQARRVGGNKVALSGNKKNMSHCGPQGIWKTERNSELIKVKATKGSVDRNNTANVLHFDLGGRAMPMTQQQRMS